MNVSVAEDVKRARRLEFALEIVDAAIDADCSSRSRRTDDARMALVEGL